MNSTINPKNILFRLFADTFGDAFEIAPYYGISTVTLNAPFVFLTHVGSSLNGVTYPHRFRGVTESGDSSMHTIYGDNPDYCYCHPLQTCRSLQVSNADRAGSFWV